MSTSCSLIHKYTQQKEKHAQTDSRIRKPRPAFGAKFHAQNRIQGRSRQRHPQSYRGYRHHPHRQSFGIAHHAAHRQTGRAECRRRILQRKAYAVIHAHEPGRKHPAREILPPAIGRTPTAKKADVEKYRGGKNQEPGAAPKVPWQKT